MIDVKQNFSGRMLFRMLIAGILVVLAGLASMDFIRDLYLEHQITPTGLIINSGIILIFLLGLAKVIATLLRYAREEKALSAFVSRLEINHENPASGISSKSLIYDRYRTVLTLSRQHAPINQSALASLLLAAESTRTSFARYVGNILILTGVFGTIVSLSIALVGASGLLDTAKDMGNMGLVIHGMSTALSTTITAIVCYLFFGYFVIKLNDAQTHLISGIEEVTAQYLLPRYSHDKDSMLHEVTGLVRGLREATEGMRAIQTDYAEAGARLHQVISALSANMDVLAGDVTRIKGLLRDGFRLPPEGD